MSPAETFPPAPAVNQPGVERYLFRPDVVLAQRDAAPAQPLSIEFAWAVASTARQAAH